MARAKTGGRVAGVPNKVTATVKENILCVFTRLEGTAGMAKWAKENQTEFYKLYARLLPIQSEVTADITTYELSPEERKKRIAELTSKL